MIWTPDGNKAGNIQPTAYDLEQKANRARHKLEAAFKEFHQLATDKVLDKNKSAGVKTTEKKVVDDLLHAVVALEQANQGQGFLSLMTISIRETLAMRDRINDLEYELYLSKRDIKNLQKAQAPATVLKDGKDGEK